MSDKKDWTPATIEDVIGIGETGGGALECQRRGETRRFHVPLKLIDEDSEVYTGGTDGKLIIPQWLATEKKLV